MLYPSKILEKPDPIPEDKPEAGSEDKPDGVPVENPAKPDLIPQDKPDAGPDEKPGAKPGANKCQQGFILVKINSAEECRAQNMPCPAKALLSSGDRCICQDNLTLKILNKEWTCVCNNGKPPVDGECGNRATGLFGLSMQMTICIGVIALLLIVVTCVLAFCCRESRGTLKMDSNTRGETSARNEVISHEVFATKF